ncbi:MAG: hypothetical protein GTO63_23405 [Anaerolineae bacterium]|nr:hypothetical protein [Anaerolineae bacterium]NIN97689.1 hypothetical protein [Anaerolineae bacterium]NIQ80672.1 hypothetical protein [Anaerolineae bacterium]
MTAAGDGKKPGFRVGEKARDNSDFAQQLIAGIKQVVEDETAKRQYQA